MKKLLLSLLLSGSIASSFVSAQVEETNINNELNKLNGESQVSKQDDTLLDTSIFAEETTTDADLNLDDINDYDLSLTNKTAKENKIEDTLSADESEDIPAVCPALFDDLEKEETIATENDAITDSSLENVDKTPSIEDIEVTEEINLNNLNDEDLAPESEMTEDTTVDMEV